MKILILFFLSVILTGRSTTIIQKLKENVERGRIIKGVKCSSSLKRGKVQRLLNLKQL